MARIRPVPHAVALFAAALAASAQAQTLQTAQGTLQPVTITGGAGAAPTADVTGFGDVPLAELPVSATVVPRAEIERSGARRLADLTRLDPSVTDGYNAAGYWDFVTIRGFTIDNRFNYRR